MGKRNPALAYFITSTMIFIWVVLIHGIYAALTGNIIWMPVKKQSFPGDYEGDLLIPVAVSLFFYPIVLVAYYGGEFDNVKGRIKFHPIKGWHEVVIFFVGPITLFIAFACIFLYNFFQQAD